MISHSHLVHAGPLVPALLQDPVAPVLCPPPSSQTCYIQLSMGFL